MEIEQICRRLRPHRALCAISSARLPAILRACCFSRSFNGSEPTALTPTGVIDFRSAENEFRHHALGFRNQPISGVRLRVLLPDDAPARERSCDVKMLFPALVAAALASTAYSAWSETNQPKPGIPNESSQRAMPSAGPSKPGTPGLPGSKSGPPPAVTVGEGAAMRTPGGLKPNVPPDATGAGAPEITKQQDVSGVPGLPGSKSGPAARAPK